MDRMAYWFLDAAIEHAISVGVLGPTYDDLENLLNRRHHGLISDQVITALSTLYQQEAIVFLLPETLESLVDDHGYQEHPLVVTAGEIEAALWGEGSLEYMLTAHGGARWEAVSCPDWGRSFTTSVAGHDLMGMACGGSREIMEHYLALYYYAQPVIETSKVWTDLVPWPATYWKTLPHGYRVDFRITPIDYRETP